MKPASQHRFSSPRVPEGARAAIVWSTYDPEVTGAMLDAAVEAWAEAGGEPGSLTTHTAPGSFELPLLALSLASTGSYDAIVALGCIVRGETTHDEHIAGAVANGIMQASMDTGVPIAFGVLTVNTRSQALDRAGGSRGNKGTEAMHAAIASLTTLETISGELA